jgi:DNA-binding LytR/AlgR family response regulator
MSRGPNARPGAIIADDEPELARYLRERLEAKWPELEIRGIAANGPEAKAMIADEEPDIAFLDIRMPGLSGLDVAKDLDGVHVVFVTAYDQYALEAFDRAAVDYLLKPVDDERLAATIARLKSRLDVAAPAARATPDLVAAIAMLREHLPGLANGGGPTGRLAWIRAAVGAQVKLIPVEDVCYFEANDKYTSVFTADAEALIRTPLRVLLAQLDPDRFWQVHRGTIVNLDAVAGVLREDAERQFVLLKLRQERLPISRQFTHLFKQM